LLRTKLSTASNLDLLHLTFSPVVGRPTQPLDPQPKLIQANQIAQITCSSI